MKRRTKARVRLLFRSHPPGRFVLLSSLALARSLSLTLLQRYVVIQQTLFGQLPPLCNRCCDNTTRDGPEENNSSAGTTMHGFWDKKHRISRCSVVAWHHCTECRLHNDHLHPFLMERCVFDSCASFWPHNGPAKDTIKREETMLS